MPLQVNNKFKASFKAIVQRKQNSKEWYWSFNVPYTYNWPSLNFPRSSDQLESFRMLMTECTLWIDNGHLQQCSYPGFPLIKLTSKQYTFYTILSKEQRIEIGLTFPGPLPVTFHPLGLTVHPPKLLRDCQVESTNWALYFQGLSHWFKHTCENISKPTGGDIKQSATKIPLSIQIPTLHSIHPVGPHSMVRVWQQKARPWNKFWMKNIYKYKWRGKGNDWGQVLLPQSYQVVSGGCFICRSSVFMASPHCKSFPKDSRKTSFLIMRM